MDIQDSDLLWIAREGLKCKLPADWKACKTTVGDIFYYNFNTQESQWEHPRDEEWKLLYAREKESKLMKGVGSKGKPPLNSNTSSKTKLQSMPMPNKNMHSVHSIHSMENMELDSNSKSNSLKRLDMQDDGRDSRNSCPSNISGTCSKTESKSELLEN